MSDPSVRPLEMRATNWPTNGDPNPPKLQRLFWALSEGAAAIALLVGSRNDPERALNSLKAVSVVAGLPFTIILMYMVHALYYAVKEEVGELDEDRKNFATACIPAGPRQFVADIPAFVEASVFPSIGVKRTLDRVGDPLALSYAALHGALWLASVVLLAISPLDANLRMCAAAFYLGCAVIVAYTRRAVRAHCAIEHGDLITDACIGVLFYNFAIVQHEKELDADAGGAVEGEKA